LLQQIDAKNLVNLKPTPEMPSSSNDSSLIIFEKPNCIVGGMNNVHRACDVNHAAIFQSVSTNPGCLFDFDTKQLSTGNGEFETSQLILPYVFYSAVRENTFHIPSVRSKYVVDPMVAFEAEVHHAGKSVVKHMWETPTVDMELDASTTRRWIFRIYTPEEKLKYETWLASYESEDMAESLWLDPSVGYMHHMRTPLTLLPVFKEAAAQYKRGENDRVFSRILRSNMEACNACEGQSMVMDYGFSNRYAGPLLQRLQETCSSLTIDEKMQQRKSKK
jgi:hypothetical protein